MGKRSSMSADDNATAGAIRALLRHMPDEARKAVLADADRNADPQARTEIRDIIRVEEINRQR